jgi:hypothetical protein
MNEVWAIAKEIIGLIGGRDAIRAEVRRLYREAHAAGVTVGDLVALLEHHGIRVGPRGVKPTDVAELATIRCAMSRLYKETTGPERTLERARRHRERMAKVRLAKGSKPRFRSLSRMKPWEAEGISRRTWYRRRKTLVGTSLCAQK